MSSLINISNTRDLQQYHNEQTAHDILKLNDYSIEYGLALNEQEAMELVEARNRALDDTGRVEFGTGAVVGLICEFCSSSFINRYNYAETLNELIELFYYYKTEKKDKISDNDLIKKMRECYDNKYYGSIELMQGRELKYMEDYGKEPEMYGGEYDDS